MSFVIAFVKYNNLDLNNILDTYLAPLLYHHMDKNTRTNIMNRLNFELWNLIEKYVTFVTCPDTTKLLDIIHENMGQYLDGDSKLVTKYSFSNSHKFIEIVYLHKDNNNYNKSKVNELGCLANLDHNFVQDTFCFIAYDYDIDSEKYLKISDVTNKDIIRSIKRRYFNSACLVDNTKIDKLYYQKTTTLCSRIFDNNVTQAIYETVDTSKYLLHCVHIPNNPINTYVNKIATRICRKKIFGPALFFSIYKMDNKDTVIYENISVRELKFLNILSFGDLSEVCDSTIDDSLDTVVVPDEFGTKQKKIYPIWSKHVYKLYAQKNKLFMNTLCYSCNLNLIKNKEIECSDCYAYRFCSDICKNTKSHKCIVK